MNCQKVQSKISELSADTLSAREASDILTHFAACHSCQQCWEEYQQTMFVLSTSTQPIPGAARSQQMWSYCQQRITETEIDARYSSPARAALRNSINETSHSGVLGWIGGQPRWSWVALGGAVAVLAATWFVTAPGQHNSTTPPVTSAQLTPPSHFNSVDYPPVPTPSQPTLILPSYDSSSPTVFQAPPPPASRFVDHPVMSGENPLRDMTSSSSSVVSYTVPSHTD